jgi:hypothetical protein
MKKGWTTTKLIAAGSLGVLLMLLALLGNVINAVTGSSFFGGAYNIFIYPLLLVINLLVVRQPGSATITFLVYGVLSIPFPVHGSPGFFPKIAILAIGGFIADVIFFLLKRNKRIASLIVSGPVLWWFGIAIMITTRLFNLPGQEMVLKVVFTPLWFVGLFGVGAISGYLGYLIYQRIKNTAVVKRIQA